MGKKFESMKEKAKEGTDSFKKSGELGKKAVADVKQMKGLIDSLPTDVDDEIVNAAKAVEQGTKSDAEGYMKSEVNTKMEEGRQSMDQATDQANEQIKFNEDTKKIFSQMDSVGSFGKAAREQGNQAIDKSTDQFNKAIQENNEATRQAQSDFQQQLSDISSTF